MIRLDDLERAAKTAQRRIGAPAEAKQLFPTPEDWAERLDELTGLPDGWADDDGTAPSEAALLVARLLLDHVSCLPDVDRPGIFPTPDGGVSLEWRGVWATITSDGQAEVDHFCDSGDFDRSICPEPCNTMHSFCALCGQLMDHCANLAEPNAPQPMTVQALADDLVETFTRTKCALVEHREHAGLSLEVMGERTGYGAAGIESFERYDADPRLSMLRRYALAVGARLEITVLPVQVNQTIEQEIANV